MIAMRARACGGPKRLLIGALASMLLLSNLSSLAVADVFELVTGGSVRGQAPPAAERRKDGPLRVRVSPKIAITLNAQQVRQAMRESEYEIEYRRIAPTYADSIAEQWKLAEWCRERRLTDERSRHLARILALDPQHGPARRGLGYTQVAGRWVQRDAHRREQGYQYYRGRWRLPQEIEILEERSKQELAEKEWRGKIKRWRAALESEDYAAALAQLEAIRDASAVPALTERLQSDRSRHAKLAYIESLSAIAAPGAFSALAECSLADADEEVFHAAVDAVVFRRAPEAMLFYVKALRDADNLRVNRAAYVLGRLNEERAVGPLIDSLVTSHVFVAPGRGGGAGLTSASFGRSADGGPAGSMLESGADPQVVHRQLQNPAVLATLVKLTGKNLGYDQQAWRAWQNSAAQVNASLAPSQ
jgi:hypothetical protein